MSRKRHVYVVSTGACGTHILSQYLRNNGFDLNHHGWESHTNIATKPPTGSTVIYLYAHPLNTILGLIRLNAFGDGFAISNMGGQKSEYNKGKPWNIDNYAERGIDLFRFRDHMMNWLGFSDRDYKLLVVRYEMLPDKRWQLLRMLGVHQEQRALQWKRRRSDWGQLTEPTKTRLYDMYRDFIQFQDTLDPVFALSTGDYVNNNARVVRGGRVPPADELPRIRIKKTGEILSGKDYEVLKR